MKEEFLHRFFIKACLKGQGLGSHLLNFAEDYLRSVGKLAVHVHLGIPKEVWVESYHFYPKHGYRFYQETYLRKEL